MANADTRLPHCCHSKYHGADSTTKTQNIKEQCTNREDWQLSKGALARLCPGKSAHEGFRTLQEGTVLNMTDSYTQPRIPIRVVPFGDNYVLKQL